MTPVELLARLALAVAVTLVLAHGLGRVVGAFRQPPVVGEMIAGLLLGPTLLGALPGDPSKVIFPSQVTSVMTTLAEVGLIVYLLFVGIDLGEAGPSAGGRSLLQISMPSFAVPFIFGVLLGEHLYGRYHVVAGKTVSPLVFALFMGTAFSTTAFPVLARILTDTGMDHDLLGCLAIRCAAVLDVLGWFMLALVLAIADSKGPGSLLRMTVECLGLVALLVVLVRPVLGRLIECHTQPRRLPALIALVVLLTLACAEATQALGLHPMLGAVIFGAVFPRKRRPEFVATLTAKVRPVAVTVFLPLYFLLPGLTINLRRLDVGQIADLVLILLIACAGKLLGTGVASLASGFGFRDSAVLGILMNTRGLIELVVLNVGLSTHLISHDLYGLLVVMALTTTMMTGPVLNILYEPYARRTQARKQVLLSGVFRPLEGGTDLGA